MVAVEAGDEGGMEVKSEKLGKAWKAAIDGKTLNAVLTEDRNEKGRQEVSGLHGRRVRTEIQDADKIGRQLRKTAEEVVKDARKDK